LRTLGRGEVWKVNSPQRRGTNVGGNAGEPKPSRFLKDRFPAENQGTRRFKFD